MAEAIVRTLLGETAEVVSAGLETGEGLPPTKHAVSVMQEMGLDISGHSSRDIETLDLRAFDLIIAMTSGIALRLVELGADITKITKLDVPDPYLKGIEVYRSTAEAINQQLRALLRI
jgi:protein-tyrosine-phosphatase